MCAAFLVAWGAALQFLARDATLGAPPFVLAALLAASGIFPLLEIAALSFFGAWLLAYAPVPVSELFWHLALPAFSFFILRIAPLRPFVGGLGSVLAGILLFPLLFLSPQAFFSDPARYAAVSFAAVLYGAFVHIALFRFLPFSGRRGIM